MGGYNDVYTNGLLPIPRRIRKEVKRTTFLTDHFFGGAGGQLSDQRVITLKIAEKGRVAAKQAEFGSRVFLQILATDIS